ncbi:alpha/beta fold hydrolase [Gordonia paraffinivorans]|uniref:alpha/beta fold hydrolase n=1 Tax=Gordonia paraffinivorans TaxID=175628 RepID=UPI003FCE724B
MKTFVSGDLRLQFIDLGPTDGQTVVLLHGFPQDSSSWSEVGGLLADAGFRVLIPDLRGYSPEAQPRELAEYTVDALVGDVVALLDSHGLAAAHIVGHDWGGSLVWTMRKTHPSRMATATVVSTPHPAALSWAWTHTGQLLRSWYMGAIALPLLPELVVRRRLAWLLERSRLPAERATHYQELMNRPGVTTGALNWYRQMLRDTVLPKRRTGSARDSAPPPRTLYIWGTEDAYFNRAVAEKTVETVSDLTFVPIESGSHWLPETEPEVLAMRITGHIDSAV